MSQFSLGKCQAASTRKGVMLGHCCALESVVCRSQGCCQNYVWNHSLWSDGIKTLVAVLAYDFPAPSPSLHIPASVVQHIAHSVVLINHLHINAIEQVRKSLTKNKSEGLEGLGYG